MIVSGTGHRPDYLGGYDQETLDNLVLVAKRALKELDAKLVITGMAQGWDTALALAAWELRIPFHAYIPFLGQESKWPEKAQERFNWLLSKAEEVVFVCEPGYSPWKMHRRNEAMNEAADLVLALYDEAKPTGGTAGCVKDALKRNKPVKNAWGIFVGDRQSLTDIAA